MINDTISIYHIILTQYHDLSGFENGSHDNSISHTSNRQGDVDI
jgi:hypothetical protein